VIEDGVDVDCVVVMVSRYDQDLLHQRRASPQFGSKPLWLDVRFRGLLSFDRRALEFAIRLKSAEATVSLNCPGKSETAFY
jgi:hypothetical protein